MKILVIDASTGLGGGQRWSRDFSAWLARRHETSFDTTSLRRNEPFDVCFDMRPVGLPLFAKKHYTWCHVPLSPTNTENLHQTQIIASSKWSHDLIKTAWGLNSTVIMPYGKPRGRPNIQKEGILFFGRLTNPKGVMNAIEIYRRGKFDAPMTVAGATWSSPKDFLEMVRKECKELGIRLIEDPEESNIQKLYEDHNVFLQTAGWRAGPPEAFGLAVADAYLSGLEIVAYPAGAVIEWLPKDNWASSFDEFVAKTKAALVSKTPPDLDVCLNISEYGFEERVKGSLPCLLKP